MSHPTMVRLILARHAEAEGTREFRFNGSSDVALTERGMRQALLLGDALCVLGVAAVYTSPLRRARATAEAIATRVRVPVQVAPDLREQSYGSWERLTAEEARSRDPKRFAAWTTGTNIAPPAGESLIMLRRRVVACVAEIAGHHPGETVALVSHVGPVKVMLCAALGLPLTGVRRIWSDPASYCVVDWRIADDGTQRSVVRVVNVTSHLDEPPRWLTLL